MDLYSNTDINIMFWWFQMNWFSILTDQWMVVDTTYWIYGGDLEWFGGIHMYHRGLQGQINKYRNVEEEFLHVLLLWGIWSWSCIQMYTECIWLQTTSISIRKRWDWPMKQGHTYVLGNGRWSRMRTQMWYVSPPVQQYTSVNDGCGHTEKSVE